jgi:hypothetical protein
MFYNVLSLNFHIHVSVSDLYIPRIGLPRTYPGNIKEVHSYETGNEAMQFHFLEYMFRIFGTVQQDIRQSLPFLYLGIICAVKSRL